MVSIKLAWLKIRVQGKWSRSIWNQIMTSHEIRSTFNGVHIRARGVASKSLRGGRPGLCGTAGLASPRQGMASLYLTKETRLNWPRISRPRAEDYVAKTIDTAKNINTRKIVFWDCDDTPILPTWLEVTIKGSMYCSSQEWRCDGKQCQKS